MIHIQRYLTQHPDCDLLVQREQVYVIGATKDDNGFAAAIVRRDDRSTEFDATGATLAEAIANLEAKAAEVNAEHERDEMDAAIRENERIERRVGTHHTSDVREAAYFDGF